MTLTVTTPCQQVSPARHTWPLAGGLPASWEVDAMCMGDVADEQDVTGQVGKSGRGGDVRAEPGENSAPHWRCADRRA